MASKLMVVAKGQQVALVSGWEENEKFLGVGTVVSQSAGGQITVAFKGMPTYRWNGTFRYDAAGYPKGEAVGTIRCFREGEDPSAMVAETEAKAKVKADAKRAEQDAKQAIRDAEIERCIDWATFNAHVTAQNTVIGMIYIVEFTFKAGRKVALVMRFGEPETRWGDNSIRVEIMVNDKRSDERIDGGITTGDTNCVDPIKVAGGWIYSWAGVEWLTE